MTSKAMTILFVSAGNLHENNACTTRIFDQLYASIDTQHHTIFFLGFISLKTFLLENKALKKRYAEILNHGIKKAFFVPLSFTTNPTLIGNAAQMFAGLIITMVSRLFLVNLVHSSPDEADLLTCRAKQFGLKRPVVADLHGAAPEEYIDAASLSTVNAEVFRFINDTEQDIIRLADTVMLVSHKMADHLRQKYAPFPKRTLVIPCVVAIRQNNFEADVRTELRHHLGLDNKFVVLYCGSLAVAYQKAEHIITLFAAIKQFIPDSILFLLTPDRDKGIQLCSQACISIQDCMIKYVPHEEVGRYMQVGDIGLLPRENKLLNHVSSPTKFGEYLAAGTPVILSPFINDAAVIVQKCNVGFVSSNWTSVSPDMKKFLLSVLDERDIWYKRCRNFVRNHYTWNLMADKIISEWKELA